MVYVMGEADVAAGAAALGDQESAVWQTVSRDAEGQALIAVGEISGLWSQLNKEIKTRKCLKCYFLIACVQMGHKWRWI